MAGEFRYNTDADRVAAYERLTVPGVLPVDVLHRTGEVYCIDCVRAVIFAIAPTTADYEDYGTDCIHDPNFLVHGQICCLCSKEFK
jgi:hypothetical protein